MALGLVPKIIGAIDVVVTVGKELGMVDAKVVKLGHIQHIITALAVGARAGPPFATQVSAVRAPPGLEAISRDQRSQHRNKAKALAQLETILALAQIESDADML